MPASTKKTNEKEISDLFLTTVSELAFEYDCKLLECGYNEEERLWWISVDGLSTNQLKMEKALMGMFGEWNEDKTKLVKIPIIVIK